MSDWEIWEFWACWCNHEASWCNWAILEVNRLLPVMESRPHYLTPRPRPHHSRPRPRPRPDHSRPRPPLPRPRPLKSETKTETETQYFSCAISVYTKNIIFSLGIWESTDWVLFSCWLHINAILQLQAMEQEKICCVAHSSINGTRHLPTYGGTFPLYYYL